MTPGELTQEEMLAQLRTRGFEDGFPSTPLRDFWGTLRGIRGTLNTNVTPNRVEVNYYFEEVEVITSVTPYTDPIAEITIPNSTRRQSGMGVFGASIDKVINVGLAEDADASQIKGQDYLLDKRIHMKMTGGHMMWDGRKKQEVPRECWEVVEVEGEGIEPEPIPQPAPKPAARAPQPLPKAPAPAQLKNDAGGKQAIDLAEGKTEQQFYNEFFKNPTLKFNSLLVTKVMNRKLLQELVDGGLLEKDEDGVYHKAEQPF